MGRKPAFRLQQIELQQSVFATPATSLRRSQKTREGLDKPLVGSSALVVDDDESTREMEAMLLQLLGFRVETVASGEEAVRYLTNRHVDLLVLDMIMPGIDGKETYRQVLQRRPVQRAIIVSGTGMCDPVAEAMEMGVSAYVCKPVRFDLLAEAVKHALARDS